MYTVSELHFLQGSFIEIVVDHYLNVESEQL